MRIKSLLLFIVLFCAASQSYAGFILKNHFVPMSAVAGHPATDTLKRVRSRAEVFAPGYQEQRRAERRQRHEDEMKNRGDRKAGRGQGGGLGIAALVCACTVYYFPLAIIFGAIAMRKGRRNWKLARAGFIIGVAEAVLYAFLITAISLSF